MANSVQLRSALSATIHGTSDDNYDGSYEINVAPLLVDKKTGQVVWQGKDSRTSFKVGTVSPWTVLLNGRVTLSGRIAQVVPRDGNGNIVPGTWKIGLFQVGKPTRNGWNDLFFNSSGHKTPVEGTNGTMIATLGTTEEITDRGYIASYRLPTLLKADVEKNSNYRLTVWYDVTETPNASNWTQADMTAVTGKLDFSRTSFLEFFDMGGGDFWVDQRGMSYSAQGNWMMLTDRDASQQIDLSVGNWLGNQN